MPSAKRVLISTMAGDFHTWIVAAALKKQGVDVVRLFHADFPLRQTASFEFDSDRYRLQLQGSALPPMDADAVDVVWSRRHMRPIPHPDVLSADRAFANHQVREFSEALWQSCGTSAFWVNPPAAERRAERKPLQLRIAQDVGFEIPRTLISNDPLRVRAFVESLGDECIYKPLYPCDWVTEDEVRSVYTSAVRVEDLPAPAMIQACPGIYQQTVPKRFEVRAAFFGAECCAIRIDSQATQAGRLDWRKAQAREPLPAQPVDVPDEIMARCRRFMSTLGIVYGSFDFIVTPDGRWIFVEVNQAGQFIFIESWCPQIPVVDIFCRFLQSRDPDFRYVPSVEALRLDHLERDPDTAALHADEFEEHLNPYEGGTLLAAAAAA